MIMRYTKIGTIKFITRRMIAVIVNRTKKKKKKKASQGVTQAFIVIKFHNSLGRKIELIILFER